ncbi:MULTISPECIES: hypothetical protein [Bacteroidales]|uniref:hypothetical protein n=2 Tax=Bacteroidia TaxID=200643 RepID=UPI002595D305|nr:MULTISPECIES: hypothetical protein [Bacteroidales]
MDRLLVVLYRQNISKSNTLQSYFKNCAAIHPFIKLVVWDNEIPQCDRLHYLGRIQREYIFDIMDAAKALMMPFVVNELIKSVNPVKLYEYIFSGKPVFVPEYGEMEQFRPYVYEYNNENEFMHLTDLLTSGQLKDKYDLDSGKCFAKSNDWNSRCDQKQHLIHQSQILRS